VPGVVDEGCRHSDVAPQWLIIGGTRGAEKGLPSRRYAVVLFRTGAFHDRQVLETVFLP
jgi:hypothetical protein